MKKLIVLILILISTSSIQAMDKQTPEAKRVATEMQQKQLQQMFNELKNRPIGPNEHMVSQRLRSYLQQNLPLSAFQRAQLCQYWLHVAARRSVKLYVEFRSACKFYACQP
ncbi:hypothetical protein HOM50_03260 [bacterium]|jgi:hypothetical protein|nr:hypothetical protein [bacterium]MBT5015395.1 hypothetical protein [bacterium]